MKKWMALLMSVLALGLVAVGCGGDDDDENGDGAATTEQPAPADTGPAETEADGGGELKIAADETQLAFDTTELTAPAGTVTITMDNPSEIPHNVAIEGSGVDEEGDTVEKGGVSTVSADLEPGEYTFYCSVAGHQEAGMEGTLTVE
jgi:plastocyanin